MYSLFLGTASIPAFCTPFYLLLHCIFTSYTRKLLLPPITIHLPTPRGSKHANFFFSNPKSFFFYGSLQHAIICYLHDHFDGTSPIHEKKFFLFFRKAPFHHSHFRRDLQAAFQFQFPPPYRRVTFHLPILKRLL